MDNIIGYVRRQSRRFADLPFGEVDALVLAQACYADMPDDVSRLDELSERHGTLPHRLRAFDIRHPLSSLRHAPLPTMTLATLPPPAEAHHMVHVVDPQLVHDLHDALSSSPRYRDVRVGAFSRHFDESAQTQFAAVTYLLDDPDGTLVIAYRGTDDTLVGWREDFNMAFQYPVPAQRQALLYLQSVAKLWPGPIVLTGHSKGGNLAVYAAMNAPTRLAKRIRHVWSLDGPGFPGEVVRSEAWTAVVDKVTKIVPDSSLVGMILETPDPCETVMSSTEGIMQHLAFSWLIDGDAFVRCPDMAASSQTFYRNLNAWMAELTPAQREHAVDGLFAVLEASGATTFAGLMAAMPGALPPMLTAAAGLEPQERRHIGEALRIMAAAALARNKAVSRASRRAGQSI